MDAFNISCEFTMFEYIIYSNNQNILKFKRTNIKYRCSITYNLYCEIDVAGEGTIGRAAAPIIIMQRPQKEPMTHIQQNLSTKVSTWLC